MSKHLEDLAPEDVVPAERVSRFAWQPGDLEIVPPDRAEDAAFRRDLVDDADGVVRSTR